MLSDAGFAINDLPLTKDDLGLMAEVLGIDVHYSDDNFTFGRKWLTAIVNSVEEHEFLEVWNDFICWNEEDKKNMRVAAAINFLENTQTTDDPNALHNNLIRITRINDKNLKLTVFGDSFKAMD
jgi:hypothetical protein